MRVRCHDRALRVAMRYEMLQKRMTLMSPFDVFCHAACEFIIDTLFIDFLPLPLFSRHVFAAAFLPALMLPRMLPARLLSYTPPDARHFSPRLLRRFFHALRRRRPPRY